ncbi:MAG: MiaB/RimO family radical SAM methylthiotransferase, partial [Candidatus Limnocylindrales bacterium]
MTKLRTAAITNLGCKVNQAEMDGAERLLRASGVRLVDGHETADLYLVNTCTVTAVADHKSRQAVRRARRTNPGAEILVTGCSVQVGPSAFSAVDLAARLLDNRAKDRLLAELATLLDLPDGREMPTLSGVEVAWGDAAGTILAPGAGTGVWPTLAPGQAIPGVADERTAIDRTRAFVKVQDGCSFHCTYCIIPRARGPERSLAPEVVLTDVRRALAAGHREIVLTGINIGTYDGGASERGPRGSHAWAALSLAGLVRRILAETAVERIRLSSIEPQHVDDELLAAWTREGAGRCLPHFHLPLQSGDDGVLRRMGRRYTSDGYAGVVGRIRAVLPEAAIHADVIVGFPTEDEPAFERTVRVARDAGLTKLHVFPYSPRPGTVTERDDPVPPAVKRDRGGRLRAHSDEA